MRWIDVLIPGEGRSGGRQERGGPEDQSMGRPGGERTARPSASRRRARAQMRAWAARASERAHRGQGVEVLAHQGRGPGGQHRQQAVPQLRGGGLERREQVRRGDLAQDFAQGAVVQAPQVLEGEEQGAHRRGQVRVLGLSIPARVARASSGGRAFRMAATWRARSGLAPEEDRGPVARVERGPGVLAEREAAPVAEREAELRAEPETGERGGMFSPKGVAGRRDHSPGRAAMPRPPAKTPAKRCLHGGVGPIEALDAGSLAP